MTAWKLRIGLANILGFDIPRLNAELASARQGAEQLHERIGMLEIENARLRAMPIADQPAETPVIPTATRLRNILTALLDTYEGTRGLSCDAYCDTPQWHAMAEAQYLEAIAIAQSAGLLSDAQARQRALTSVERLRNGSLHREAGVYAQWGLGFRWQDFPANESFLVTTALVTRSLVTAMPLVDCVDLAREALAGLARMPRAEVMIEDERVALPVYAPSLPEVVENTVALWAQVVLGVHELLPLDPEILCDAELALKWLDARFVQSLGWAYSETRPVFDLMHQVYILEGLRSHPDATMVEERAVEIFAGFRMGSGYIDSLTLMSREMALKNAERSGGQYVVFRGDRVLSARTDPARLWSLGGMLGSFALFALHGERNGYWLSQIRRFPFQILPDRFGADFRQEMHLARGAALALKALREIPVARQSG